MTGQVSMGGGWNNSQLDKMSPSARSRIDRADAEYEAEGRRLERERDQAREERHERAVQLSIQQALDAGEEFDMRRARREGVGHTRQQMRERVIAACDREDAMQNAAMAKEFAAFQQQFYGDTSAPTPAEKVELEESTARAARNAEVRRNREVEARRKAKEQRELNQRIVRFSQSTIRNTRAMEGW